jgi:hypothetical protein
VLFGFFVSCNKEAKKMFLKSGLQTANPEAADVSVVICGIEVIIERFLRLDYSHFIH